MTTTEVHELFAKLLRDKQETRYSEGSQSAERDRERQRETKTKTERIFVCVPIMVCLPTCGYNLTIYYTVS